MQSLDVLDTKPKVQLNVVETSGNARERGLQYGRKCKGLIDRFVDALYVSYKESHGRSKNQLLLQAKRYVPFLEEYSSEVAEEIRGIAEGAGRAYEELVMTVAYYEIGETRSSLPVQGCTALAATGKGTVDGTVYIGQTWDDNLAYWWDGQINTLLNMRCDSGLNILAYTYPGIPPAAGLNSEGISLCWNSLHCEQAAVGVPTYAIVREVLGARRIGDAIGAITRAKRAESFNMMIADKDGEVYDIEATPNELDILYATKFISHANHFKSRKLRIQRDTILDILPDTIVRDNRMSKLLEQNCGNIDLDKSMQLLRDHVNYPHSICKHAHKTRRLIFDLTYASWVLVPAKREMWITHGIPCQSEFVRYSAQSS